MAYLRKEIKKGKTYLSICENYRAASGKPSRRVLRNLGNVESIGEESLKRIAEQILSILNVVVKQEEGIEELTRVNYGFAHVIYQVLKEYDLVSFFARISKRHKLSYSLLPPALLMLCDRLQEPQSKLKSHQYQQEYFGLNKIELQHLYRSLDYLSDYNEDIQNCIYAKNRTLFDYELDVVFFDVTTFYFDSDIEKPDELRQLGFGKDGKIGKTQILFSLLIDKNKMPIGFEIFNGKQYEGHTFESAIEKLKKKYAIDKVIVVADSGMMNRSNIELFQKNNIAEQYEYIVGERLKNLPQAIKQKLINKENYIHDIHTKDECFAKVCIVSHENKTIIGTWSAKRAAKDKAERETRIVKAQTLLKNSSQLKKKPRNYYLKTSDKITYEIDQDRIQEDALYDGFKAIATNTKTVSIETILSHYSHLYQIEYSFRTFKSFLETRPMFHWTDQRIKGHLVMCYMAFIVLRFIETKTGLTENVIRKTLSKMQLSKIKNNEELFWLRSASDDTIAHLLQKLNLKPIPNTISQNSIKNYLPAFL